MDSSNRVAGLSFFLSCLTVEIWHLVRTICSLMSISLRYRDFMKDCPSGELKQEVRVHVFA